MTATSFASPTPRNHRWPPILAVALVVSLLSPTPTRSAAASPADACTLTQTTPGTVDNDPYVALGPNAVSGDGRFVTFGSYEDLTGENPGRDYRVFVYDTTSDTFDQLDGDAIPEGMPSISEDGAYVTFTGAVGQDFEPEVFLRDQISATTNQLIDSPYGSQPVALSADGTRVLYLEQLWDIPDALGPWAIRILDRQTETTTEVAADAGITPTDPVNPPHLSPDGMMATFVQEGPLQRNELLLYDSTDDTPGPTHGVSLGALSADGSTIALSGTADLTGENPFNGEQLFIATTCDPAPRPDARIATTNDGPYAGSDLYSSAPRSDQRRSATIEPGGTRSFFVQVQNDRSEPDTFSLSGADAGAAGYDVTYRRAGADITAAVEQGAYSTGLLDPGAFTTIKVTVHAQADAGRGHRVDVVARSDTNVVARDTVRAKVTRRS